MDAVEMMLTSIVRDPVDLMAWSVLADSLEDAGRVNEAELVRLREMLRGADLDDPARPINERRMQDLLAAGVQPISPTMQLQVWEEMWMTFRLIPPGVGWLGSPKDENGREEDEHEQEQVKLRTGFWLGEVPVTNEQWRALIDEGPDGSIHLQAPATMLDGVRYATRLGHVTGRDVKLPSEEQWEYACRAGTTSPYHGGGVETLHLIAHQAMNFPTGQCPQPVRRLIPNAWGLYDMHGNVWEQTSTWDSFPGIGWSSGTIVRGGSFRSMPSRCRSAARTLVVSGFNDNSFGFRLMVEL